MWVSVVFCCDARASKLHSTWNLRSHPGSNPISCIAEWILSCWAPGKPQNCLFLNICPQSRGFYSPDGRAINWKAIMRILGMYSRVVMFWNDEEMYASSVALQGPTSHEELGAGRGVCGPWLSGTNCLGVMSIISEVHQGHSAHTHSQASQGTWQGRDRAKIWTHTPATPKPDS